TRPEWLAKPRTHCAPAKDPTKRRRRRSASGSRAEPGNSPPAYRVGEIFVTLRSWRSRLQMCNFLDPSLCGITLPSQEALNSALYIRLRAEYNLKNRSPPTAGASDPATKDPGASSTVSFASHVPPTENRPRSGSTQGSINVR